VFRNDKLSVMEWIFLLVILTIPILNVVFAVWMFIRGKASETVKNFFVAYLILYLFAWVGILGGVFDNMQGLFS